MRRHARTDAPVRLAASVAVLLASLSVVTWRQSRTLEALAENERLGSEIALAAAELTELERRVRQLESYGRVVEASRERLGMRTAAAEDIVILSGELR